MAQFQAYNKLLISQAEEIMNYRAGGCILGYLFCSQYPSYRGTFLSCIEDMKVYVDGEQIPEDRIYFQLKGKQFLISQFRELYKEYWFILDKAKILVRKDGGLEMGSSHKIRVEMKHRIPYTGYFGNYLSLDGSDEKTLAVKGEVQTL